MEAASAKRCPGEPECERYAAAAGNSPEEKALACIGCTTCRGMTPTPETAGEDDAEQAAQAEEMADAIERLVWEQQAGRRFELSELSPEEWQLIVLWRGLEKEFDRVNQLKIAAILETAFLKKA